MKENKTEYRPNEEDLKRLKLLRPMDDDFMRCLFKDDLELVQYVLRIIMQNHSLTLRESETQKDFKRLQGARSISLDVYGLDTFRSKYDLEIQRADKGAGAKRARYHGSIMDVESLHAGQDFDQLPTTYIIFITENDVFKAGAPLYPIEHINMVTNEIYHCGQHILYVNGAYDGTDEIGMLMHDFRCSDANDMYSAKIAEKTRYLKEDPKGVNFVCKLMEDMRNESFNKGVEVAIKKMISAVIEKQHCTAEQAMDYLDIPASDRETYLTKL